MPTPQDDSIRTFTGHSTGITSLSIASDGHTVLSAAWESGLLDHLIQWDMTTGTEIKLGVKNSPAFKARSADTLTSGSFTSVAYTPDSRGALFSWGFALLIVHVPTGDYQELEAHAGPIQSLIVGSDGRTALSGSMDKTCKLWDIAKGKEIRSFQQSHSVSALAFDGRYALSGDNEILRLWNVTTGEQIETHHGFKGHSGVINSVVFGRGVSMWTALSGSADGTLKLWDVLVGRELLTFEGHESDVLAVDLAPDGRTAISGSRDGIIKLWDVYAGKELRTLRGHSDWVQAIAFAPDGRTAISGSQDKTLKQWDVAA